MAARIDLCGQLGAHVPLQGTLVELFARIVSTDGGLDAINEDVKGGHTRVVCEDRAAHSITVQLLVLFVGLTINLNWERKCDHSCMIDAALHTKTKRTQSAQDIHYTLLM